MKTLSQIAKELGVSRATVSYVYNNKWREQRINEVQAAKIMEAIKEAGCMPDPLGRQLKTGRTNTIGVLLTDLERYFNLELLGGIQKRLAETDYLMLLGNSYFGRNEYSFFSRMRSRKVDGMIFCPSGKSEETSGILKTDSSNVVFLDNYLPEFPDIPRVITDNQTGSAMLVRHCAASGRRKIAWIGGNEKNAVLNERYEGFLAAMKKNKLELYGGLVSRGLLLDEAIEKILSHGIPDALLFDSLVYIDKVYDLLKKKKLIEKALITGFDKPSAVMDIAYVKQDTDRMGAMAAEILTGIISGKIPDKKEYLVKPEFIEPGKEK